MTIELKSSDEAVEQVELFSIDGVSYTIPNKVRANITLKMMRMIRTDGEMAASAWLVEELVGEEGFNALCDYDDLTDEQFEQVLKAARLIALGETEEDEKAGGSGKASGVRRPKKSGAGR